jgi:hypothetical protein
MFTDRAVARKLPLPWVRCKVRRSKGRSRREPAKRKLPRSPWTWILQRRISAKTPHAGQVGAPSTYLVLPAPGQSAANNTKVHDALANVKGVNAKASNAEKDEIHVKLDDSGGAKLAEIKTALKNAGLTK